MAKMTLEEIAAQRAEIAAQNAHLDEMEKEALAETRAQDF